MLSVLQSPYGRTALAFFGELAVAGVWAMIDGDFVTQHAEWFLVAGTVGLALTFWADRIWKYLLWERKQARKSTRPDTEQDEHLAARKAKSQGQLVRSICKIRLFQFDADPEKRQVKVAKEAFKAVTLSHSAGYGEGMRTALLHYSTLCQEGPGPATNEAGKIEELLLEFLNKRIDFEVVKAALPRELHFRVAGESKDGGSHILEIRPLTEGHG